MVEDDYRMAVTSWAALVFGLFAAFALADWISVQRRLARLERVFKPLALLALIVVAVLVDPRSETQRTWFVVALAFSLVGDVFLMLDRRFFVAGLASFLVAHLSYVGGFLQQDIGGGTLLLTLVVLGLSLGPIALRVIRAARARDRRLGVPVSAYVSVIVVMVSFAVASGSPLAATGALLFMVSDALIGWNRFVSALGWAPVTIMVTYHSAQALLVLSLL